jgi:hypothetical protein
MFDMRRREFITCSAARQPLPDDALRIEARGEKEDGAQAA